MIPQFDIDLLWTLLKWVYVFVFGLYVVFALVVYAQITRMVTTLRGGPEFPIKLLGIAHLLVAIGVLLAAILIL